MKLICAQGELAAFLQIAVRAAAVKSTLPILTGILLETRTNVLRCVATDLEIAIEVLIPNVQIFEPGTIVVAAKTFVDIIRHFSSAPVTLEFDEKNKMAVITSKTSAYQLPVLPVEEFPSLPERQDGTEN